MKDDSRGSAGREILRIRAFRADGAGADSDAEEPRDAEAEAGTRQPDPADRDEAEAFWAGRNHAMRRSARIAA